MVRRLKEVKPSAPAIQVVAQPSGGGLSKEEIASKLFELDQMFTSGQIGLEEYLSERDKLLKMTSASKSRIVEFGEKIESEFIRGLGVVLIESGLLGVKVQTFNIDRNMLPREFDDNFYRYLYEFYSKLDQSIRGVHLEFAGWRIARICFREGKLALLVGRIRGVPEDYERLAFEIGSVLDREKDWITALPRVFEEVGKKFPLIRV